MPTKLTTALVTTLVVVLVLALTGMLHRPLAAQAQSPAGATSQPAQMAVDHGTVYVLRGDVLSIYIIDDKTTRALLPDKIKLVLLLSQDVKLIR